MIVDLSQIPADGLELDHRFALGGDDEGEPVLAGRVRLAGRARPDRRGVELQAHLEAPVRLECSRCVEAYDHPVAADFSLLLVAEASEFGAGEARMAGEDAALFYCDRSRVDLREIAREQILLNLPLKPVCRSDCKGLCPTCGVNRNRIECSCRPDEIDPRLEPLLALKKKMDGRRSRS